MAHAPHVVVIDGQVLQTSAWHRGIGKYSVELLKALRDSPLELHLVLSSRLTQQHVAELAELLPGVSTVLLDLRKSENGTGPVVEANRAVLDAHLAGFAAGAGARVTFLSLGVMLGEAAAVLPSLPGVRRLVVVYDLIPLMFHDTYLRDPRAAAIYLSRVGELLRADHFVAISRTVGNDLAVQLGVPPERISAIDAGPVDHVSGATARKDVPEPFILMPTGNDRRKNNRRGIEGFGRFNERHDNRYALVVTSTFLPSQTAQLGRLAPGVVFTGNVSSEELADLYHRCEALLFPPEYEGLGLPILEAVEHAKPIACSHIAAFREMSDAAFHTFDPRSVAGIADALERAVLQPAVDRAAYAQILERYTWANAAAQLHEILDAPAPEPGPGTRPRVVVIGADPGTSSSGRVLQELHGELVRVADPSYVLGHPSGPVAPRADFLRWSVGVTRITPGLDFSPGAYDRVVIHLDDDPACAGALFLALGTPATIVLHGLSLRSTWAAMVDEGLVHPSRLALEQQLDVATGGGGRLLTSVVARARRVLVPADDGLDAGLKLLVTALPDPPPVEVFGRPLAALPYPTVRPTPSVLTRDVADLPVGLTDQALRTEHAELWFALTDGADDRRLLELLRLGVVPISVGNPAGAGVSAGLAAATPQDAQELAWEVVRTPGRYQELSGQVAGRLAAEHDPGALLEALLRERDS